MIQPHAGNTAGPEFRRPGRFRDPGAGHGPTRPRQGMAGPLRRTARLGLAALLALLTLLPDQAGADTGALQPQRLRFGFLRRVFYESDLRDIRAALDVHMRQVSRSMGLEQPPHIAIFNDTSAMAGALRRGELEAVTMPTIEYLRLRNRVPLIPAIVSANNSGLGSRYVVIARAESGIGSVAGLRSKTILLPPIARHDLGHIWLETLIARIGGKHPGEFFRQTRESAKMSHAIMGVFLGQADAAVVTRAGLDTNRQLNPQLNSRLIVLAESRNLSDGVTCLIPSTPESFRSSLTRTLMRLNGTRGGKQLFTLFHSSGVTHFMPSQLEGLEQLLREHERLKSNPATRK